MKSINDILGKIDKKVFQEKLKQAVEMIKKGEHQDIIKKLEGMNKDELLKKLKDIENMPGDELKALRENFSQNVKNEDLKSLKENLSDDNKKMLEKIISTFKKS